MMKLESTRSVVSGDMGNQESPKIVTKKSKKKRKREKEDESSLLPINDDQLRGNEETPTPTNFRIEVIGGGQNDRAPPIVGYFPSGYNPHKSNISNGLQKFEGELDPPPPSLPSVRFYRNVQRGKVEKILEEKNEKRKGSERLELVVSPHGSNVEFVGKNYKGEATAAQLCTHALGVLDKEAGTLKIMPIAGNKIFRLEPKVPGLGTADKETLVSENLELSEQEKEHRRRELAVRYGSNASVARDKKLEALNKVDDPGAQEALGMKIDNAPVNKEALEQATSQVVRNIPPHNSSAATPQDAYPLNRIILAGEWDFLGDIHGIVWTGAEVTANAYPTFICNRIHKLQEIEDESEKKKLSSIFSYINHLIKFKDLHSLDGASSAKNHRLPRILRERFIEMFTPEARKLPAEKIDLLISYVIVLTLYADDFRTNLADIAKDLRMSPITLRVHFENLGCKLERENKLLVATLPVPLEFPRLRQRQRRRR